LLLATITIILVLLSLRTAGERVRPGVFQQQRKPVKSNARCWTPPAAALIAMLSLGGWWTIDAM